MLPGDIETNVLNYLLEDGDLYSTSKFKTLEVAPWHSDKLNFVGTL